MRLQKTCQRRTRAGFSLVEVTLALGIAALGIIAVLGLMPQGLEMSRKTGELTSRRQITEQIVRDLEQRSWADLALTTSGNILYFDDQGAPCSLNSPTQAFIVRTEVNLSLANVLPLGSPSEPYLRRVKIKIANTTNPSFDFSDNNSRNFDTVIHYIAKTR